MDVSIQLILKNKSQVMDCMKVLKSINNLHEIVTLAFHFIFIETVPCSILHGIAPDEYKWEKLFPFFYENGSTVFILVNFDDGNCVKPLFLFTYYYLRTIFIPGLLTTIYLSPFGTVFGFITGFCIWIFKRIYILNYIKLW